VSDRVSDTLIPCGLVSNRQRRYLPVILIVKLNIIFLIKNIDVQLGIQFVSGISVSLLIDGCMWQFMWLLLTCFV